MTTEDQPVEPVTEQDEHDPLESEADVGSGEEDDGS